MHDKLLLILTFLLGITISGFSQTLDEDEASNNRMPYKKEMSLDLRMHSYGFGAGVKYGIIKSDRLTWLLQAQFNSLKHHREVRQSFDIVQGPLANAPKAFIYAKQNNFYSLQLGAGGKRYFSRKGKKKVISIALSYSIGPTVGILKPYYLDLIRPIPGTSDFEIVSERYSLDNRAEFLSLNAIYGASGFGYGIDELMFRLGGYGQGAIHFDWGALNSFMKAIEVGIMIDAFGGQIPIMVEDGVVLDNKSLFFNVYVALQFGNRS